MPQILYILLYSQFFIHNVFTFNIDILSKENNKNINIMRMNEWKCISNNDCTARNSVCNDHLCQCEPGSIFNSDMTACVKIATKLYDSCEDTVQCSAYLLSGAKCVENICVCGPGYYYLHGKCNRYVGLFEKCKQNIDCYVNADFEASTCDAVEKICKCTPGFYQREYRTCRREGKAIGDECLIDIDCTFGNATCNNFVCAIKPQTVGLLSDVILTKGILDEGTRIDSDCTTNEDCKTLGNATCDSTKKCRCNRAHFASFTNTKCISELGESCRDNDVSYIEKSICREGRWSCMTGTVASKDNRECLNATTEYMGNCRLDEQCYIFGPDAICSNNKCICNENVSRYLEKELFCWGNKGLGEICKQDRDCYVKDFKGDLVCSGTCDCSNGTRLSKNKMACVGSAELGGICEKSSDCVTAHSICEKQVCACANNYYKSNKQCVAGINADCTSDKNCAPKNALCISKKCSCKSNYVSVSVDSCIPVSLFGKPCLRNIQCSAITTDAICTTIENKNNTVGLIELSTIAESKLCMCKKEDYYRFGRCFKRRVLGESCTNLGECYESYNQNRIVCKNGKCSCTWGYMKSNESVCVEDPQGSRFFFKGSATNVVSMRLFSVIFIFFIKLF